MRVPWLLWSLVWPGVLVLFPSLRLAVMGPTYFGVRFFVELFFVALLLQLLLLRTSAVLRTIGDPSHDVFLVRKELRSQRVEIVVVRAL